LATARPTSVEEEPLGALVGRLGTDVRRIVQAEMRLLQIRTLAGIDAVRSTGFGLAVGLVLALGGVGAVVAGLILLMAFWIPAWMAALVVGGALVAVGGVIAGAELRVLRGRLGEAVAPIELEVPRGG